MYPAVRSETGNIMLTVEYLNYGKLVSADGTVAPVSSGLGITRLSGGLDQREAASLDLASLFGTREFGLDTIDEASAATGALLVRSMPVARGSLAGRTVFARVRHRKDREHGGNARMHPQASMWIATADDWRRYPAALLAAAADRLHAEPDTSDEPQSRRIGGKALGIDIPDGNQRSEMPDQVWRILDTLTGGVPGTLSDRSQRFGSDPEYGFSDESAFLDAVGMALQELQRYSGAFSRWSDISVCSGATVRLGGLFIGYAPSDTTEPYGAVDRDAVERRLRNSASQRHVSSRPSTLHPIPPAPAQRVSQEPADRFSRTPAREESREGLFGRREHLPSSDGSPLDHEIRRFEQSLERMLKRERVQASFEPTDDEVETIFAASAKLIPEWHRVTNKLSARGAGVLSVVRQTQSIPDNTQFPIGFLYDICIANIHTRKIVQDNKREYWFRRFFEAVAAQDMVFRPEYGRITKISYDLDRLGKTFKLHRYASREFIERSVSLIDCIEEMDRFGSMRKRHPDRFPAQSIRSRIETVRVSRNTPTLFGFQNEISLNGIHLMSADELEKTLFDLVLLSI